MMMLVCTMAAYSQFWIEFGWHDSHCRGCDWMIHSLRMTERQARDYQKVVHQYGEKIEREVRRDYKHWNSVYRKIYNWRMDRDHKIERILSPQQFGMYIRYSREDPRLIHDYRGWYDDPRYSGYPIMPDWRRYEDNYWTFRWGGRDYRNYRWNYDNRYDNRDYRDDRNNGRYQEPPRVAPSPQKPGNQGNQGNNKNNGNNKPNNNSRDNNPRATTPGRR